MSSEQQETVAIKAIGDEVPPAQRELTRETERKLPQEAVAALIAERLDVPPEDEATRTRLHQLVRTFGRTQALSLCDQGKGASQEQEHADELPTRVAQFFALAEAKGIPKQRHWKKDTSHQKAGDSKRNQKAQAQTVTVAQMIAEQLAEKHWTARQIIVRGVKVLGEETALSLLQETHAKEAAGGVMLPDGSRRRTPGGVYFYLVKQATSAAQQQQIFGYAVGTPRRTQATSQAQPQGPVASPALVWTERHPVLQEADKDKGEVRPVKITVIGRPKTVGERNQCVVMSMQQGPTIPSLPKGLPLPTKVEATTYTVYIASKQWHKVTEALKDLEDVLIVEGWPMIDTKEHRIAVFANAVTTKNLQIAKKQV